MPAPELQPQVPGEPTATDETTATGPSEAELTAVLDATVDEITSGLPALTDDELPVLLQLETAGKNRVTLLRAIEDEIQRRAEPEAEAAAAEQLQVAQKPIADDGVVRVTTQPSPVLTEAGWVVPEPELKA